MMRQQTSNIRAISRQLKANSYLLIVISITFLLFTSCTKEKIDYNAEVNNTGNEEVAASVANPTFKIRLINRMETMAESVESMGYMYPLEDLISTVTLTYADGTPVSNETTDIAVNAASGYIELPYGTYQFRVLTADGRQIPADEEEDYKYFHPTTSRMYSSVSTLSASPLTFSQVTTFQPGGTYTISVRPNVFRFKIPVLPYSAEGRQNQFLVIADEIPVTNNQYGKVQAVNAFSDAAVSFRVNGEVIASQTPYGSASEYISVTTGSSSVEVLDASGNVLANTELSVGSGQNISLWLWPEADGTASLLPVYNDLSSVYFSYSNSEYLLDNRIEGDLFPTAIRFLNLCPDEPYISFTSDDGEDLRESVVAKVISPYTYLRWEDEVVYNLQPGVPVTSFPYTRWVANYGTSFNLLAYRSRPGIIPGSWASDVAILPSEAFTASTDLYTQAGRDVPNLEAGIYTVALIGRTGSAANSSNGAKMIVVKHNR